MIQVFPTTFADARVFVPDVFEDDRGFFKETWSDPKYAALGLDMRFAQDSCSRSARNVIRGLHYDFRMAKLVQCLRGRIWDVIVDVRRDSPTYLQWEGFELTDRNHKQLFVPAGFAHGFLALDDDVIVHYKNSVPYDAGHRRRGELAQPAHRRAWPLAPGAAAAVGEGRRRARRIFCHDGVTLRVIARPFGSTGRDVPIVGQGTWNVPTRGARADEAKRALRRGIELGMVHVDTRRDVRRRRRGAAARRSDRGAAARAALPRLQSAAVQRDVRRHDPRVRGVAQTDARRLPRLLPAALARQRAARRDDARARAARARRQDARARREQLRGLRSGRSARRARDRADRVQPGALPSAASAPSKRTSCRTAASTTSRSSRYTPFGRGDWADRPGARVLDEIARKRGATPHQVILAFLTREPINFAIPKSSTVEHVEENAGAGDLRLDEAEIAAIDEAFPVRRRRGGLPTL